MSKNDKVVIVFILVSVFLFLFMTKTVVSGFHFVDDHEIIKIKSELQNNDLFYVALRWVKEDIFNNTRFRPVYYVVRVLQTKIFGSDFILWSLFYGFLCFIALVFSYLGMRNFKFSINESIVFLIVVFVGPQCSVWWRLGPGESLGMTLLSLSFYFMSKPRSNQYYTLNNSLFILFLILASLIKESFIIIIPAFIFLKIWIEKESIWSSLKESLLKNIILLVPLIIMILEIIIILFCVGTGYAGLNSALIEKLSASISTFIGFISTYLNLIIAGVIILFISLFNKKNSYKIDFSSFIFFLLILVPNIILYSGTGMNKRYLLPAAFGLGFFVVTVISRINIKGFFKENIALTVIVVSFLPNMVKSTHEAIDFSKDGFNTNRLLEAIPVNNKSEIDALLITDPVYFYELSVSLKTYLFYEKKIELYGYELLSRMQNEAGLAYIDGWKLHFNERLYANMTSRPELLIFFDRKQINAFFLTSSLTPGDYSEKDIGDSNFALFMIK